MKKLVIVALALLAVGCEREEVGEEEAQPPENVLMQDTLSPDAQPADTAGALTVILEEWTIRLARDTVPAASPTVLRVRNNGEVPHILEVEGQGNEWMTDTIPPGEWRSLEADLTPGRYEVYCPIESDLGVHADLGMRTWLVVRDTAGGG